MKTHSPEARVNIVHESDNNWSWISAHKSKQDIGRYLIGLIFLLITGCFGLLLFFYLM